MFIPIDYIANDIGGITGFNHLIIDIIKHISSIFGYKINNKKPKGDRFTLLPLGFDFMLYFSTDHFL